MLWWTSKKKVKDLEKKTQDGFSAMKKDIESIGAWIKHLDNQNKQLFDFISTFHGDLSSMNDELASLREGVELISNERENKQLFQKLPVLDKQTGVDDVQKVVQTAVQTDNLHGILKNLTANERLLVFTLLNSDMKLSYEDLSLLLGKERSTIRGQINSIKQKSDILIQEISEKNGKKRVFVPEEIRTKMQKYAKVRVGKGGKKK